MAIGLPPELWIRAILPRLSLRSLAVARCVCRQWRASIFAAASSAAQFGTASEGNWDLRRPHLVVAVGELKIGVLMEEDGWKAISIPEGIGAGALCCVSEGLFCFSSERSWAALLEGHLVVGNPFTNRWKRLPAVPLPPLTPPPSPDPFPSDWPAALVLGFDNLGVIGMMADHVTSSYTILILASTEFTCFAFEYTSSSASWSLYQQPLIQGLTPFCYHTNLTLLHGKAYYLGTTTNPHLRPTLVSYDMVDHSWTLICVLPERIPIAAHPIGFQMSDFDLSTWDRAQLLQCRDELRLVGTLAWRHTNSFLLSWSYWWVRVDPNHGPILDSMESLPPHSNGGCPLHRCVEFAIAPSYADPSLCWLVFNHPRAKTICYDSTMRSWTSRFEPPGGITPLEDFMRWTCSGAFHQPLIWNAPL